MAVRWSLPGASDTEIDAAGKHIFQNLEGLRDFVGAVMVSITPPEPTRISRVAEATGSP